MKTCDEWKARAELAESKLRACEKDAREMADLLQVALDCQVSLPFGGWFDNARTAVAAIGAVPATDQTQPDTDAEQQAANTGQSPPASAE